MPVGRDEVASASRRRPPWGFVGMLAIVVAIESNVPRFALDLIEPNHWDWRNNGRASTRGDLMKDREILIFGDSLIKYSVLPGVIRNLTGKKAFNLALSSGQTSTSYFLLRRAFEAGARPSAIVFDVTPHMFMYSPKINRELWSELLTVGEAFDLAQASCDAESFGSILLAEALPSYQQRHEIANRVLGLLRGTDQSPRDQNYVYLRNWKVNEGAQLESLNPAPIFDPDEWNLKLYPYWAPDSVNIVYLDRFLALARSRQVPVYWLLPPIHPAVQDRIERSGFDQLFLSFARQVQSRFPETTIIDARHSGFVGEEFKDVVHLNRLGAVKLSTALAGLLGDPRPSSGPLSWVTLDPGRAKLVDLPMEDLTKSAEFLRDEGRKVRR